MPHRPRPRRRSGARRAAPHRPAHRARRRRRRRPRTVAGRDVQQRGPRRSPKSRSSVKGSGPTTPARDAPGKRHAHRPNLRNPIPEPGTATLLRHESIRSLARAHPSEQNRYLGGRAGQLCPRRPGACKSRRKIPRIMDALSSHVGADGRRVFVSGRNMTTKSGPSMAGSRLWSERAFFGNHEQSRCRAGTPSEWSR